MAEPLGRAVLAFVTLVICCGALIAATAALTRDRIEANHAGRFLETLSAVTGSVEAAAEMRWSGDVAYLCPDQALLRGTARGYGGEIRWLAAADVSGAAPALGNVRVTSHQETPGIADFLDRPGAGWLGALAGTTNAGLPGVDSVSGATITSRGLLRSLAAALAQPAVEKPECPR